VEKRVTLKIVDVLDGKAFDKPPVWLMRQAGRYLPEYRTLRARTGSFLEMCYTPELAIEITMQPIRRFGFDAAILFSDILVIPDALGQKVRFEENRGPVLEPIGEQNIDSLVCDGALERLRPVMEAVSGVRMALAKDTALLGFCGAPWTVATYMIAGHGTPEQAPARLFAYRAPKRFAMLIDTLVEVSSQYLVAQFRAGADAVQIFDSWAGILGDGEFDRWCVEPVRRMVDLVRAQIPDARIIGFPKGAAFRLGDYRQRTGVSCIAMDWTVPLAQARNLQANGAVQGNLDPVRLVAGGDALDAGVDAIIATLGEGPLIFNLGHGITPDTPISHVERLLRRVRG
jgi:uroporphyrinogen decarboxylase